MSRPRREHPASAPSSVPRGGLFSDRRLLAVGAAGFLAAAVIAIAVVVLPKMWQVGTGPSRQAGREFAAQRLQTGTPAGAATDFDIDMRCIAAADRAATQGTQLDNGRHLTPGMIIRAEFRNACIDEAHRRLGRNE